MRPGSQFASIRWAILLGCLAARAWGQEAPVEPVPGDVERWIRQLGAGEYVVRDQATRSLIAAGSQAVEPVVKAVRGDNLEVTTRGVYILQELALSGDERTEEFARQALENLIAHRPGPTAHRAEQALEVLDELRQQRALAELQQLGAVVNTDYQEMGLAVADIFAVEIGPQWQGTTEDLKRLRWLHDVEQITFVGPQVTDEWVRHVQGMERLAIVKIRQAHVTAAALATLRDLPRLRYVKLLYVGIGDGAVEHLTRCPQIAKVFAYGTQISEAAEKQLKAAGVDIDRRKGAFLGISVPPTNDGENWFINSVTPNSSAERAGLEPGDVITKFDNQPVRDFGGLMAMIGQMDAGKTVTIEIRRRGDTLIRTITLGEWE
jgi:hypothetical protein